MAYLIGRYPAVSHTFIRRELAALERLGVSVARFSIWPPSPDQTLTPADRLEAGRTRSLRPPRIATLRAHLALLARRPGAYVAALRRALSLARPGLRGLALAAVWWLEAVTLYDACRRRGIRHVHAHLNGTAPAVALLTAFVANTADPAPDARWTWSMTVHGPADFYDLWGERLADKVKAADFVVCISDFARSQLMTVADPADWSKLVVVRCGVSLGPGSAPRSASSDAPLRILNVARLAPTKGQAILLQATAELRRRGLDVRTTIVGGGPERDRLVALAGELGIADDVTLTGPLGEDRLAPLFDAADVVCLPSFAEGVPIVLMEAMAKAIPVVATRVMGVSELVQEEVSGLLVPPARPDLLADALERLAHDPLSRVRMGRAGRKVVAQHYDIDRSARQLAQLFCSTPAWQAAPSGGAVIEPRSSAAA